MPSFQEVQALLDRAILLHPADHQSRVLKAAAMMEQAERETDEAVALNLRSGAEACLRTGLPLTPYAFQLSSLLAQLEADSGRSQEAMTTLESALSLKPNDPNLLVLGGQIALQLGNDPSTFGTYLDYQFPTVTAPLLAPSSDEKADDPILKGALAHLGKHPMSQEALKVVSDRAYALGEQANPSTRLLGNRAVARQRVLIHLEEGDETPGASRRLAIALNKDPNLLDAHYLLARLSATLGDEAQLITSVETLLERGVNAGVIRDRVLRDSLPDSAREAFLKALP
jgi:tetratricopeptide (TPR) repeat protein